MPATTSIPALEALRKEMAHVARRTASVARALAQETRTRRAKARKVLRAQLMASLKEAS